MSDPVDQKTYVEIPPSNLDELAELSKYLVETESKLSAFWLLCPDLKMISKDGKILKVSPMWTTLLGYAEADLLGEEWKKFIHPEDLNKSFELKDQLENIGVITNFKNRWRDKTGKKWLTLEWSARMDPYTKLVFSTAIDRSHEAEQAEELVRLFNETVHSKEQLELCKTCCYKNFFK